MSKILDSINSPEDLKKVAIEALPQVASEIREYIISSLSEQGGHLGANLGVIELTMALHYVFNSPDDKIVWDVSHQCYTHKILTGRKEQLPTIRKENGLLGFTNIHESPHDHFTVGHASTAFSQALGLACARDFDGKKDHIVSICGDGALTGGLCYEALNNIGHLKPDMLLILNDNELSIDKNVGSVSKYLNSILTNPLYNRIREEVEHQVERFPRFKRFLKNTEESIKNIVVPGIVFEELGIRYFGPIDGHNLHQMIKTLERLKDFDGPCLLHVITQKAKGIDFDEDEPSASYHSYGPYCVNDETENGVTISGVKKKKDTIPYTKAFSQSIVEIAQDDPKVVAITAAMPAGTGLNEFQKVFPNRFYDVGIAEGHAITFASGLSRGGYKPVCAIYSTFLQRAFDHLIHDGALQEANITVCMDRAGLCGPDGPSHHGLFDLGYFRLIPNSVLCSPWNLGEMKRMIQLGVDYQGVFGIRYPKDEISHTAGDKLHFEIGEGQVVTEGEDLAILSLGNMVEVGLDVAAHLNQHDIKASVYNMRFIKPLDPSLMELISKKYSMIVTIEEHVATGGLFSAVSEYFFENNLNGKTIKRFSFPDTFIEHGSRSYLLKKYQLDADSISQQLIGEYRQCNR